MADRDKDRAATRHSYGDHGKDNYRDRQHNANQHVDRKYLHEQYQHKKHQHKKHRAETIKQRKLAAKHQHRIATYRHYDGNNYKHWRERRDYQKPLSYRTHYLRYHRGHKRSHHQHDDNYLEWVTTMLLLNELLDDGYRYP
jgi:hypothetical protein